MVAEAAAGGARATVQRSGDRHPGQTILAVSGELQLAQTTVELKLHELIFGLLFLVMLEMLSIK